MAACLACGEGDETTDPTEDASAPFVCTSAPDAGTALGVRGVDLWNAFVGAHTIVANGTSLQGGNLTSKEPATFTLAISRSDAQLPGLADCGSVSVPVEVLVQSAAPSISEGAVGVLRGSPLNAFVSFATPQGMTLRVSGLLHLVLGEEPELDLRTDANTRWTSVREATP